MAFSFGGLAASEG